MSRRAVVLVAVVVLALAGGAFVLASSDDESLPRRTSGGERSPNPQRSTRPTPPEEPADADDQGGLRGLLGASFDDLIRCAQTARPDAADLFGGPSANGSLDAQVRGIARVVERLRELNFASPVDAEFLGSKRFDETIRDQFRSEYSEEAARIDGQILTLLGVLEPGTDLRALSERLLEGQAAGFYLPGSGRLVVRADRQKSLDGLEKVTLAHELEHALADQVLDLPLSGKSDPSAADEELARLALVEGDASLLMQHYMLTLPFTEQLGLALDPTVFASADALDEVPHFIARSLIFPYVEGLTFVCDLYARGGWAAVDRAYEDPPDSTTEILFPMRYRSDFQPVVPPMPEAPRGWSVEQTRSFGPAELLWLFEAPGDDSERALNEAVERVADWRGGRLTLWSKADEYALSITLVQGSSLDLCHSLATWYERSRPNDLFTQGPEDGPSDQVLGATGDDQDAQLFCDGDEVRLGIGPDGRTALALAR